MFVANAALCMLTVLVGLVALWSLLYDLEREA